MKASKYNVFTVVSDDKHIIYNTLTRKYFIYEKQEQNFIDNIMNELNNMQYELSKVPYIKEFLRKGIVIRDDVDEFEVIKYKEAKARYQQQFYYLTIQPTLQCNFRCTYCYEEHKNLVLNDTTSQNLLRFIDNITKQYKFLRISWFGGEPMLQFKKIEDLTQEIVSICNKNGCMYKAIMTSNGYLFNERSISLLKELNIGSIQITVDGDEKYHNKQRSLINGGGTFGVVTRNIVKLLDEGIHVNLRVNVSNENFNNISDVLDIIPHSKRKKVTLTLANLFQNSGSINLFGLYMAAIDKGYLYYDTSCLTQRCEANYTGSTNITPEGKICTCSMAGERNFYFGTINSSGNINFERESEYFKFKNMSVLDSKKCRACTQLPMCMGGCKLKRYEDAEICTALIPEGMSLEEKIRLHYYSDIKNCNIMEVNSI